MSDTNVQNKTTKKMRAPRVILSVIGLILCVVFGFMLICNLTIIIKGTIDPDRPPAVFGTTPMVVLSGSMSGNAEDHIEVGDLIFVGKVDPDDLVVGDVITFAEEESTAFTTHRIIEITVEENGDRLFWTKGDANNAADQDPVTEDRVIGIFELRIPKVGDFALFLQQPLGMGIFIGVPLCAFILYDIIRRQRQANKNDRKADELQAELERLRKLAGEKAGDDSAAE